MGENKSTEDSEKLPAVVKINKWDGSAVKNALDDAVKDVLKTDLELDENCSLMDGRLVFCALSVGVALYALLWDYLYPFPQSRLVLIICVTSYFVIMGILTLYTTFKENGIFVVVQEPVKSGVRMWEASSFMKKFDDKYKLIFNVYDPATKTNHEASFTKSVACFIDTEGVVVRNLVRTEVFKLWNGVFDGKDK